MEPNRKADLEHVSKVFCKVCLSFFYFIFPIYICIFFIQTNYCIDFFYMHLILMLLLYGLFYFILLTDYVLYMVCTILFFNFSLNTLVRIFYILL